MRYIIHHIPLLKVCKQQNCTCQHWHNSEKVEATEAIVDVWRRQFLRTGYKPEPVATSSIFSVCIRVPECLAERLLSCSGGEGIYIEPRSLDSKSVSSDYEVIWVPKAGKSELCHLRQVNPAVIGLARVNDRYGLRVRTAQAAALHKAIRPDAVYLANGTRQSYMVGPIPYGTDRKALSKALSSSSWEAKPLQPVSALTGERGVMWSVVAVSDPPTNIITMSHGDVVITKDKEAANDVSRTLKPVAAASTISLCGASSKSKDDPWLKVDPWGQYVPVSGGNPQQSGLATAAESIHQLESKIESAVLAKLPHVVAMDQDDVPDRVQELENRFNQMVQRQQQLESVVSDQGAQQSAQLSQMQSQLNAQGQQLAGHMDAQNQQIQSMFESQMAQIRGLLSKRPRDGDHEWLSSRGQPWGFVWSRGFGPRVFEPLPKFWRLSLCMQSFTSLLCLILSLVGLDAMPFCIFCWTTVALLTCAVVARFLQLSCFGLDGGLRTMERRLKAVLVLVWTHVFDRWCARLVSLTAFFPSIAPLATWWNTFCALKSLFHGWFYVKEPNRQVRLFSPNQQSGSGQLLRWWSLLLILSFLHRGEALNPGPSRVDVPRGGRGKTWSMGTFNPSGLGGKHQVLSSYLNHGNLWAVTETHLTSQGLRAFRQGLKWSDSEFSFCIGGHPVPLRSGSCATGSWNGVAVVSKSPTRAIPAAWGNQIYETSRVQLAATLCEDMWITGGVVYGEPPGVGHPNARENTDTLAIEVVTHLCNLSGLRYFAGDLNFESGGLEVFRVLADAGFRDIQDIAFAKWGRPVQNTCKQSTRKDFFFISSELAPFLTDVLVDDTIWADHAVLQGFFSCGPSLCTRHLWRTPGNVEWPSQFDFRFSQEYALEKDPTRKYSMMWSTIESAASHARISQGLSPFSKSQCGRGSTLDTKLVKTSFHLSPVKPVEPQMFSLCSGVSPSSTPIGFASWDDSSLSSGFANCICQILIRDMG